MTTVTGTTAAGFEGVRAAFERNFSDHGDIGAGVAVYVDGECVVDLAGGVADAGDRRGLRRRHAAAGVLDHEGHRRHRRPSPRPTRRAGLRRQGRATSGPSSARRARTDVTIAMLFDHQVGLPVIDAPLVPRRGPRGRRRSSTPWPRRRRIWEPGTAHGYHALTYGWLVGEVIRRITGRSIGEFVADELAGPLGLDLWIGLPEAEHAPGRPAGGALARARRRST